MNSDWLVCHSKILQVNTGYAHGVKCLMVSLIGVTSNSKNPTRAGLQPIVYGIDYKPARVVMQQFSNLNSQINRPA